MIEALGFTELTGTFTGRVILTVLLAMLSIGIIAAGRMARVRLADALGAALSRSITTVAVLVLIGLISFLAVSIWGQTDVVLEAINRTGIPNQAGEVVLTVGILVVTHFVSVFIKQLYNQLLGESDAVSEHQREVTYRVTQLLLYATAFIVIIGVWDQNVGGLLIGAGFAGIVLGMAARQTLGNVLAGFVLMFSRPFEVGDWVEIGADHGIVTEITVINTRIRTFDGEYVIIPNNVIRDQEVTNKSKTGRLRIEVDVGVDYDADTDQARERALAAVESVDRLLDVPTPDVVVKEFGNSSIVLGVRGWIDNPSAQRRWHARTDMIEAVKHAFEEEGIKIPFPQRELSNRPGARRSDQVAAEQQTQSGQSPAADGSGDRS